MPIGASTKRDGSGKYAGFFGEGFKIASLCAVRDHGWNVEMASRDWRLRVVVCDTKIDDHQIPSLAYQLWKSRPRSDTVLALHPFGHFEELEAAITSFFYPENPLLGDEIWSDVSAAVYHRSSQAKPRCFPATYNDSGPGIIFAGYQALGSFSYPLVIAQHNYRSRDRERNTFYRMDVVKVIQQVCGRVPSRCAFQLLELFRNQWQCYPRKRYDFESWYPIIRVLTERLAGDCEEADRFREKYARLLVADQVKRSELAAFNRRRQAMDWLRDQRPGYRLVQDGFGRLGYPRLEQVCEQAGGFAEAREPNPYERALIEILESLTTEILPGFFGEAPLPPCRVITSDRSAWQGMANCVRLSKPQPTVYGLRVFYRLPYVALKGHVFRPHGFHQAYSTYLHELAHVFGGDQSTRFSRTLTEIMQITLQRSEIVRRAATAWNKRQVTS